MNGACTTHRASLRRSIEPVEATTKVASHDPRVLTVRLEAERLFEERDTGFGHAAVRSHPFEAAYSKLHWHIGILGPQGVVSRSIGNELEIETFGIGKDERRV